jgi:chromosome partitioning protein
MRAVPAPTVIAISNQKGGEGKTTTTVNLAASIAAAEHRVLLIDMDPQGNASSSVGYPKGVAEQGTYDLLMGLAPPSEVIQSTELPMLDVIPSSMDLAGAEVELVEVEQRESVLQRSMDAILAHRDYEFILLDCPPSLGLLTINALVAATSVIIPMQAKYFSLEGLGALNNTIEAVREAFNPGLAVEGIVFCMFDNRTNLARQVVEEVSNHFEGLVYDTRIPVNIRLSESPSHGKPALLYDIESKGAQAYLALAREVLARREAPAENSSEADEAEVAEEAQA